MSLRHHLVSLYGRDPRCHYCRRVTKLVPSGMAPSEIQRARDAGVLWASADHVIPVAQRGPGIWENIVVACEGCNWKRGDDPHQMHCRPECQVARRAWVAILKHREIARQESLEAQQRRRAR